LGTSKLTGQTLIITHIFPGRYDSLSKIDKFIREVAQKTEMSDFEIYTVEMAVDEACSNIIEHAYQGEDKGDITCTCEVDDKGLTIILLDNGRPFNPELITPPDLNANLEDRESHGLGLFFIQKWMDRVEFEVTPNNGNRLTLYKQCSPPPEHNDFSPSQPEGSHPEVEEKP
jgi:serine/threonine-protein kinase RsbW